MALVRILNLDTGEWNIVPNISGVDLSNYYTKNEINNLLENLEVDLTNYYTKSETNDTFAYKSHSHSTENITSGTFASARIPTLPVSKIDSLSTQLLAKVDKATSIIAGTGLTGGGNLNDDVTLNLSSASGTAFNATRWNNYQMRVGSYSSGSSGYITFDIG